jgi:ABC-type sugar transport system substrate-binding protein
MWPRLRSTCAIAVFAAAAISCGGGSEPSETSLAAIIKGVENPFFAALRDGLTDTARRHRTDLRVATATSLQDTAGQAAKLESLAADRAACYVVNPINQTNLVQALSHVPDGATIVNVDSPVDVQAASAAGVRITTYIGTDNQAAGRLAANAMAKLVPARAEVAIVGGIPGDATSAARAEGFTAGAGRGLRVGDTVSADFNREKARLAAEDLLRTDADLKGFFAVNDEMALGVADAVRAAGKTGHVAVIGVDGIAEALDAVESGALSATVAQYPYTMGQLGIEACLEALAGKHVPQHLDAPIALVTHDNVVRARARFPQPPTPFKSPLGAS